MQETAFPGSFVTTSSTQKKRAHYVWLLWFAAVMGMTVALAALMSMRGPDPAFLAWIFFVGGVVLIVREPRYGLYIMLFLALVGDGVLTPWYPFAKNFSSRESLLYLHDAIIVSPLEVYLLLTLFAWLGREALQRKLKVYRGPLFWPTALFTLFTAAGLAYGLFKGGNVNVALWESRALFYLPLLMLLVSNLLKRQEHISHLLWAIMTALAVEGLFGLSYILFTLGAGWREVDAITEHAAAIHMNTLFLFILIVWLMGASYAKRLILPLFVPAVFITYVVTQRRAAFVALALAVILLLVVLYWENRRTFWLVVLPLSAFGLLYLAVFWNAQGVLGAPAQAVKTVIAPNQLSAVDQSSDLYRVLENINIGFTIHNNPLFGMGFGNKYQVIVALPDLSAFFQWWEYITHNSIMWIWIKMGVGGFISMLYLVGMSIMTGASLVWRVPRGEMRAAVVLATLYLVMHFTFAYVDLSWGGQDMLYVGAMIGVINCSQRILSPSAKSRPGVPATSSAARIAQRG